MKKLSLFLSLLVLFVVACKNGGGVKDFDLMQHGLPISIKAPEGVTVKKIQIGLGDDVVVEKPGEYYVHIYAEEIPMGSSVEALTQERLADVKAREEFSKIVEESKDAFVYETKWAENDIYYNFYYCYFKGDKCFTFETTTVEKYTLDQVKMMFESVKQSAK